MEMLYHMRPIESIGVISIQKLICIFKLFHYKKMLKINELNL